MVAFPCQPSHLSNANILTLPCSGCVHECFCPGMDRSGWSQDAELAASLVAAVSRTQLSAAIFPPIHPVRPAMKGGLLTARVHGGGVEGGIFRVPPQPGQCGARGRAGQLVSSRCWTRGWWQSLPRGCGFKSLRLKLLLPAGGGEGGGALRALQGGAGWRLQTASASFCCSHFILLSTKFLREAADPLSSILHTNFQKKTKQQKKPSTICDCFRCPGNGGNFPKFGWATHQADRWNHSGDGSRGSGTSIKI